MAEKAGNLWQRVFGHHDPGDATVKVVLIGVGGFPFDPLDVHVREESINPSRDVEGFQPLP